MKSLDCNIWRSSISLQTIIRLYNVYILPILLYGADTWSMTVTSNRRLDAFDQWCLRRIVHIPYTAHITDKEVRRRTGQPPITSVITKRRLIRQTDRQSGMIISLCVYCRVQWCLFFLFTGYMLSSWCEWVSEMWVGGRVVERWTRQVMLLSVLHDTDTNR